MAGYDQVVDLRVAQPSAWGRASPYRLHGPAGQPKSLHLGARRFPVRRESKSAHTGASHSSDEVTFPIMQLATAGHREDKGQGYPVEAIFSVLHHVELLAFQPHWKFLSSG